MNTSSIQWTDSTINPVMGCGGCELFPQPSEILEAVVDAVNKANPAITVSKDDVKQHFQTLVDACLEKKENAHPKHSPCVTTTNIYHLREVFAEKVKPSWGEAAAQAAIKSIEEKITCYAAILHLNKGTTILDRGSDDPRELNKGYAPTFETVTEFPGRVANAAKWKDLLGTSSTLEPWKRGLARMIFVSDMGDALSSDALMEFLEKDTMPAITSEDGKRHIWQWLTKRPERMAKFAERIGGFPPNVCAMTTLTSANAENLARLAALKKVKAQMRGLSIEPLWERIPPEKLDLSGIDWVIVGGESGNGKDSRPFHIEWAEELRDHCRQAGVAFFLKQLGSNPFRGDKPLALKDAHGGDWDEWPDELRVREFPKAFHDFRADERQDSKEERPSSEGQKQKKATAKAAAGKSPENIREFNRLNSIVSKGLAAFVEAGDALIQIKEKKLWRAGGYDSWEAYCEQVAAVSRAYANRLMRASQCFKELETLPNCHVLPKNEGQVRPLLALKDPEERKKAWGEAVKKTKNRSGVPTAEEVKAEVTAIKQAKAAPASQAPASAAPKVSRSAKRKELLNALKAEIVTIQLPDKINDIINELEGLL